MIDFPSFRSLCERRRSVHSFESSVIPKQTVQELLSAVSLSPSIGNTQPWHFHVVLNPDMLLKLVETSCYGNFVAGAGAFIVVSCDTSKKPADGKVLWNPRELEYSCAGAMEQLLLGATAMGFGSCWVSLHHGAAHEILRLPAHHRIIGAVMLGKTSAMDVEPAHSREALAASVSYYE